MSEYNGQYDIPHNSGFYYRNYDASPITTNSVRYYDRWLLQKAMSVFDWKIPGNWDLNYFLTHLYIDGYICIAKIEPLGVIPQVATIGMYNIYYNPAKMRIANPLLPKENYELEIGKECELLQLTPDYRGILDCVNEYSEMLANATCAVNTNLYNSRLAYIFYAENKAQADSFKKMYDEIGTGVPAVMVDKKLKKVDAAGNEITPYEPFNASLKSNYITTDLLEDIRRIEHLFAQKVGLPNTNSEKKGDMTTDEVNKTDVESIANCVIWKELIDKSIERIKTLYPDITLECNWRFPNPINSGFDDDIIDNEEIEGDEL